ncbi:MAG TPA: hypothetical protein VE861_11055 [Gemmatimonadaceae bacterium]|nr:hypothetical protein [Gemmatimonadaceae bacterium]
MFVQPARPHLVLPAVRRVIGRAALLLPLAAFLTGCISYTVGQGAETAPVGQKVSSTSVNVVPGTIDDDTPTRRPSVDTEVRFGLDDRTDIGFRIATWSGFMATWKRQLTRADTATQVENRPRTSIMLGGGILNMGEHAGLEATLISSGKWTRTGQLYGAVRTAYVLPLSRTAIEDDPVVGASVGYLFGDRSYSIGPELGIYYDRSALGLNTSRILVIPSVVVRASGLRGFKGLLPF